MKVGIHVRENHDQPLSTPRHPVGLGIASRKIPNDPRRHACYTLLYHEVPFTSESHESWVACSQDPMRARPVSMIRY